MPGQSTPVQHLLMRQCWRQPALPLMGLLVLPLKPKSACGMWPQLLAYTSCTITHEVSRCETGLESQWRALFPVADSAHTAACLVFTLRVWFQAVACWTQEGKCNIDN